MRSCRRQSLPPLPSVHLRSYSAGKPAPSKPRPYEPEKPLVSARPKASQDGTRLANLPKKEEGRQGVKAPYIRLAVGVVFIGAVVYSMVAPLAITAPPFG